MRATHKIMTMAEIEYRDGKNRKMDISSSSR